MPKAPAGSLAGGGRQQAGAAGQMFDKTKAEMIRPWFRQAAVPWKTTATQTRASGENRVSTKLGVLQRGAGGHVRPDDEADDGGGGERGDTAGYLPGPLAH